MSYRVIPPATRAKLQAASAKGHAVRWGKTVVERQANRDRIYAAYLACHGSQSAAARQLGLSTAAVWRVVHLVSAAPSSEETNP